MNPRRSPSGAPYPFHPLQLPAVCGFVHADAVVATGANVSAWPDLVSGGLFTLNPASTAPPTVTVVDERQWVQFHGDGVTPDVGSWLQSPLEVLAYPWRYLNSQAQFYFATTLQAPILGGQQIAVSASDRDVSNSWNALIVNQSDVPRRGSFSGQNGTVRPALLADVDPMSDEPTLWEVLARVIAPAAANPGVYDSLRVNGVIPGPFARHDPAATINDYPTAFDVTTLGGVERSGAFVNSFGGRMRCAVWAYPWISDDEIRLIRNWLQLDAGI